MLKARAAREVIVRMPNEIGALDRLAKTIADKGVNLLAICAWVEGAQAVMRLVTEDNLRVVDTLRAHHYDVREADVIVADTGHTPGMLHRVAARLAQAGIDIHHLYATASLAQQESMIVFATANNDRALVVLNAPAA